MGIFDIDFDIVSKLKFKMYYMMNYQQQHELQHELADELDAIGLKLGLSRNQVGTKSEPAWNQVCYADNTKGNMVTFLIKNQ